MESFDDSRDAASMWYIENIIKRGRYSDKGYMHIELKRSLDGVLDEFFKEKKEICRKFGNSLTFQVLLTLAWQHGYVKDRFPAHLIKAKDWRD